MSGKKTRKIDMKQVFVSLAIIGLIALGGMFGYPQYLAHQEKILHDANQIEYEVLDESVLSTEELKKWVEESKGKKGMHTKSDNDFTYILISGGKQKSTGYGISLDKMTGDKNNIYIEHQTIAPTNPNVIENKESYPNMVIRMKKDSRNIKAMESKKD